jgi:regulator of sigma E protease
MYYVIGFLILFIALILVHEFGHLIMAKILGVKVLEFSLGFPPALIKRKWGETEYMLSSIPLGGYVKALGDDPDSGEEIAPEEIHRAFFSKSLISRATIIVAGPLANYLLGVVLLCAGYAAGLPVLASEIGKILEGSPALKAGFKPGDRVVAIDGEPIWRWDDMRTTIEKSPGKLLRVQLKRDAEIIDLSVVPVVDEQKGLRGMSVGRIGVVPSGRAVNLSVLDVIYEGLRSAGYLTKLIVVTVVRLIKMEMSTKDFAGPITMAQVSGEYLKVSILSFVFFLGYMSIVIAILNLLPIPPLDGGCLLFFLIEAVTRRPVRGKIRRGVVQGGYLLIIFVMVLAFYNDISRIVTKGWKLWP